jgi:RNA-directed DNA polymerase
MERVVERSNLRLALRRVKSNKGSPGIDGMTVGDLSGLIRKFGDVLLSWVSG